MMWRGGRAWSPRGNGAGIEIDEGRREVVGEVGTGSTLVLALALGSAVAALADATGADANAGVGAAAEAGERVPFVVMGLTAGSFF